MLEFHHDFPVDPELHLEDDDDEGDDGGFYFGGEDDYDDDDQNQGNAGMSSLDDVFNTASSGSEGRF